jgi:cytochrome P450
MTDTEKPLPPGSAGWPVLGETFAFLKDGFAFIDERVKKHGPVFRTKILGRDTVVLTGKEAAAQFIDESVCVREGATPDHVRELLGGRPIGTLDGDEHRARKKQILAGFTREALTAYVPEMQKVVERCAEKWSKATEVHGVEELKKFSLEAIAMNALSMEAGETLDDLVADFARVTAGFMGLPIAVPGGAYSAGLRARDRIFSVLRAAVVNHHAQPMDDALSRILASPAADGSTMDDDTAVMELHHVHIAGYIIFAPLAALLVELAKNDAVRAKLVSEVKEHAAKGPLTLEQITKMPYLTSVVKEAKRVAPVIPTLFARVKKTFEIDGMRIPEGWFLFFALRPGHFDAKNYAEPQKFDPDRFSAARAEDAKHPHVFMPQGTGPDIGHKCPGTDYATVLMQVFATVLARDYTWTLPEQDLDLDFSRLPPEQRDGLRFQLKRT